MIDGFFNDGTTITVLNDFTVIKPLAAKKYRLNIDTCLHDSTAIPPMNQSKAASVVDRFRVEIAGRNHVRGRSLLKIHW